MAWITDEYRLTYKDQNAGWYYVFNDGTYRWSVNSWESEIKDFKDLLQQMGLSKDKETKKPIAVIEKMMTEANRVKGMKKVVYVDGDFRLTRIARETNERFLVYRCSAEKGEPGYSPKPHSAPHYEGPHTPEGMKEWTTWYAFVKMDDGTYQAELDESWWWGGGHNDGGTIRTPIPEEWFELSYDEFLENVVTLSAASHYGFTPDELKEKEGLKAFFGME